MILEGETLWVKSLDSLSTYYSDSTSVQLFDIVEAADGSLWASGTMYFKQEGPLGSIGVIYRSELYWCQIDQEGNILNEFQQNIGAVLGRDHGNSILPTR